MAETIKSKRIKELKNHFVRPATTFDQKCTTLQSLFAIRSLGRPTRVWAQQALLSLQTDPQFASVDPQEQARRSVLLDTLNERNEIAIQKAETRKRNKEAQKAGARPVGRPRKQQETPAPPPPAEDPFFTVWQRKGY